MIETYVNNLKNKLGDKKPETLLILGSGLGSLADKITNKIVIKYEHIGFPKSTVSGHAGQLVVGTLGNTEVVCMQGRFHFYEGHNLYGIQKKLNVHLYLQLEESLICYPK